MTEFTEAEYLELRRQRDELADLAELLCDYGKAELMRDDDRWEEIKAKTRKILADIRRVEGQHD